MSKQIKGSKMHQPQSQQQDQAQDLDLRLERQILLSSQAQRQLSFCQSQLNYCLQFLNRIKEEHKTMNKHYLLDKPKHFGGWESKLKQLTTAAVSGDPQISAPYDRQNKQQLQNLSECSQKNHLRQILNDKVKQEEEEQITYLQQKLQKLYQSIETLVNEEYMNDRIFIKVKRQARKASKTATLSHIDKQIQKYMNWVDQNNTKLANEMILKQVEQKVVYNLELMKLIMNKKVINNDYIYEQFEQNRASNEKIIDKIENLDKQLSSKYAKGIQSIKQKMIQFDNKDFKKTRRTTKSRKQINLNHVFRFFKDVESTMEQIDSYPIQEELEKESDLLARKLSSISVSFK